MIAKTAISSMQIRGDRAMFRVARLRVGRGTRNCYFSFGIEVRRDINSRDEKAKLSLKCMKIKIFLIKTPFYASVLFSFLSDLLIYAAGALQRAFT